jgi:dephospho-CoA kinase
MPAYRVGLTGGLASGKSTVSRRLAEAGLEVVDADRLVADLYRPGEAGARAVAALFGPELLDADGAVDKGRLGALAFADPAARRRLEAAIHPLVRERFAELARGAEGVIVLEATLLVEAGFAPDFDLVVTVEADPEVRLRRAVVRGLSQGEARARLLAQGDGAVRRAAAHLTLDNDGDPQRLLVQVDRLVARLRAAAAAAAP